MNGSMWIDRVIQRAAELAKERRRGSIRSYHLLLALLETSKSSLEHTANAEMPAAEELSAIAANEFSWQISAGGMSSHASLAIRLATPISRIRSSDQIEPPDLLYALLALEDASSSRLIDVSGINPRRLRERILPGFTETPAIIASPPVPSGQVSDDALVAVMQLDSGAVGAFGEEFVSAALAGLFEVDEAGDLETLRDQLLSLSERAISRVVRVSPGDAWKPSEQLKSRARLFAGKAGLKKVTLPALHAALAGEMVETLSSTATEDVWLALFLAAQHAERIGLNATDLLADDQEPPVSNTPIHPTVEFLRTLATGRELDDYEIDALVGESEEQAILIELAKTVGRVLAEPNDDHRMLATDAFSARRYIDALHALGYLSKPLQALDRQLTTAVKLNRRIYKAIRTSVGYRSAMAEVWAFGVRNGPRHKAYEWGREYFNVSLRAMRITDAARVGFWMMASLLGFSQTPMDGHDRTGAWFARFARRVLLTLAAAIGIVGILDIGLAAALALSLAMVAGVVGSPIAVGVVAIGGFVAGGLSLGAASLSLSALAFLVSRLVSVVAASASPRSSLDRSISTRFVGFVKAFRLPNQVSDVIATTRRLDRLAQRPTISSSTASAILRELDRIADVAGPARTYQVIESLGGVLCSRPLVQELFGQELLVRRLVVLSALGVKEESDRSLTDLAATDLGRLGRIAKVRLLRMPSLDTSDFNVPAMWSDVRRDPSFAAADSWTVVRVRSLIDRRHLQEALSLLESRGNTLDALPVGAYLTAAKQAEEVDIELALLHSQCLLDLGRPADALNYLPTVRLDDLATRNAGLALRQGRAFADCLAALGDEHFAFIIRYWLVSIAADERDSLLSHPTASEYWAETIEALVGETVGEAIKRGNVELAAAVVDDFQRILGMPAETELEAASARLLIGDVLGETLVFVTDRRGVQSWRTLPAKLSSSVGRYMHLILPVSGQQSDQTTEYRLSPLAVGGAPAKAFLATLGQLLVPRGAAASLVDWEYDRLQIHASGVGSHIPWTMLSLGGLPIVRLTELSWVAPRPSVERAAVSISPQRVLVRSARFRHTGRNLEEWANIVQSTGELSPAQFVQLVTDEALGRGSLVYTGHARPGSRFHPELGGMVLAGNRILQPDDLATRDAGYSGLVVLAACESSGFRSSRNWHGLPAMFMTKGAQAVVATQWRISDTPETASFVAGLVRSLHEAEDPVSAFNRRISDATHNWTSDESKEPAVSPLTVGAFAIFAN